MERRRLLSTLAAGTGLLAGCAGYQSERGSSGRSPTPTGTPEGFIPKSKLERVVAKDAIPAITNPAFAADWSDAEAAPLVDTNDVIGLMRDGQPRAYPLRILDWHEVVNDTLGGPLLVTYCPLCGSGITAVRTAGGEESLFGVSGRLYKNDLVMYDEATGSLWAQIEAQAVNGPLVGEELELVPSTFTTWGEWRAEHPDTDVLLPPPDSGNIADAPPRDYNKDPYPNYEDSERIGIGGSYNDDRLHPKALVLGVANSGEARAYPRVRVAEAGVVNDSVGGVPIVVTVAGEGTLVGYQRRVDGSTLTFETDGDALVAGGSRWNPMTGTAMDGPYEGQTLAPASERSPLFFFAWLNFYPETTVYGE
ncbi:DUF3179 domain-containing protein [Halosegnis sp.]|uniref:DUF3179 domain-containing protein n=1 Tax=Halosegnis sp. TaxID=2864959 RepID=UPI0035D4C4E7